MNAKKKPVNGLLIVAIMAAAVGMEAMSKILYGQQFETFVHMGQAHDVDPWKPAQRVNLDKTPGSGWVQ